MTDTMHIIAEIRRTAAENEGRALGHRSFANETGIKAHDWRGNHWIRWSDALKEAGLEPNQKQLAIKDGVLLEKLALLVIAEASREPAQESCEAHVILCSSPAGHRVLRTHFALGPGERSAQVLNRGPHVCGMTAEN